MNNNSQATFERSKTQNERKGAVSSKEERGNTKARHQHAHAHRCYRNDNLDGGYLPASSSPGSGARRTGSPHSRLHAGTSGSADANDCTDAAAEGGSPLDAVADGGWAKCSAAKPGEEHSAGSRLVCSA